MPNLTLLVKRLRTDLCFQRHWRNLPNKYLETNCSIGPTLSACYELVTCDNVAKTIHKMIDNNGHISLTTIHIQSLRLTPMVLNLQKTIGSKTSKINAFRHRGFLVHESYGQPMFCCQYIGFQKIIKITSIKSGSKYVQSYYLSKIVLRNRPILNNAGKRPSASRYALFIDLYYFC